MQALYIASTGMAAQERNVEVISNNIANMRTTGYKRQRTEFQDLLYQQYLRAGSQTSDQGTTAPVGIEVGSGVKTAATPRIMTQGTVQETESIQHRILVPPRVQGELLELAPEGEHTVEDVIGRVRLADGRIEKLHMFHRWPVRTPRPFRKERASSRSRS